jgi:hypothetical protein
VVPDTASATDASAPADRDASLWGPRAARALGVVAVLCILGWSIPALVMANRGFAVQDEGTYVLSYRWWSSNPYFVSGAQYFYGPLFAWANEQIAALRVLRLVMVIATNAWFAASFLRWLAALRGVRTLGHTWSNIALLTAAGGMAYLWTPLTPGYYDLTADASIALVALMLSTMRRAPRPPVWLGLVAGGISFVLVLTKWPAVLVVLLVQAVVLLHASRHSLGAAVRHATAFVAGLAVTTLCCQFFLFPLDEVVPNLRKVSALTATATHSLGYLAHGYALSTALYAAAALLFAVPLSAAYLIALRLSGHGHDGLARTCVVVGGLVTGLIPLAFGWHGGSDHRWAMLTVAMAALFSALVAAGLPRGARLGVHRPDRTFDTVVVLVLVAVPVLQAAGTNVPLLYVSLECLALWVAPLFIMVSRTWRSPVSRFAFETSLVVFLVTVAVLAGTTTYMSPFKTTGVSSDTDAVPSLSGLRLAPDTARQYAALEDAVAPYVQRGVTPVLTLDQLAGVTYLIGGVPMGSTWTDAASPRRTAGILALACRNGDVDRTRTPVLILDRAMDPAVRDALRGCGASYPSDFRQVAVPGGPDGLRLFVPADSGR